MQAANPIRATMALLAGAGRVVGVGVWSGRRSRLCAARTRSRRCRRATRPRAALFPRIRKVIQKSRAASPATRSAIGWGASDAGTRHDPHSPLVVRVRDDKGAVGCAAHLPPGRQFRSLRGVAWHHALAHGTARHAWQQRSLRRSASSSRIRAAMAAERSRPLRST